jgi:hypothetical protein
MGIMSTELGPAGRRAATLPYPDYSGGRKIWTVDNAPQESRSNENISDTQYDDREARGLIVGGSIGILYGMVGAAILGDGRVAVATVLGSSFIGAYIGKRLYTQGIQEPYNL